MSTQSNDTKKPIALATSAEETAPVVEKQNPAKRAWNYVKEHKKAAIAVVGLGTLIVVANALGNSNSTPEPDTTIEIRETEDGFEVVDLTRENAVTE